MNLSSGRKNLVWVLILVLTLLAGGGYWGCNNVRVSTETLEKKITGLAAGAINIQDRKAVQTIADINESLLSERYLKSTTNIQATFKTFTDKWRSAGKLPQKDVTAFQKEMDDKFSIALAYCTNLKWNQFMAILYIWLIYMGALYLFMYTDLLRDIVGNNMRIQGQDIYNENNNCPTDTQAPYSLSRTQLAVWITIISSLYLYAILWDEKKITEINNTALLLMGISAGTFAIGAILDTTEIQQGTPRNQDEPSSKWFLKDILSDEKGISVHRFQNVVWTIVAIIVYFYRYANPPAGQEDNLPVLDSTLLALTGISSATYLTLKARENGPSPDMIKILKISLAPDSSLSDAVKTNLAKNGFPGASITISSVDGTNPVHPVPDTTKPGFDFLASNIKAGTYKITATWSGTIDGQKVDLKSEKQGLFDNTANTTNPVILSMK